MFHIDFEQVTSSSKNLLGEFNPFQPVLRFISKPVIVHELILFGSSRGTKGVYFLEKYDGLSESVAFAQS